MESSIAKNKHFSFSQIHTDRFWKWKWQSCSTDRIVNIVHIASIKTVIYLVTSLHLLIQLFPVFHIYICGKGGSGGGGDDNGPAI